LSTQVPLAFRSSGQPGFSQAVLNAPGKLNARKLVREVQVRFADGECTVQTLEGVVHAHPGDAIVTGIGGEHWRVSRRHFADKYRPVPPTMPGQGGTYASLPNRILAVPMQQRFNVLLADGVSNLQGHAGDWLVDYGDGSLGIVSPTAFAKTYEIVG
jgi:hypothetical protein